MSHYRWSYLQVCLVISIFSIQLHASDMSIFSKYNQDLNKLGEGEAACAVRSDLTMRSSTLSAERRYDVEDNHCSDWNRLVILGKHIELAGKMILQDYGVTREMGENKKLTFCQYSIDPAANEIPSEALKWWQVIRLSNLNPKATPEYRALIDYATKMIHLDCTDFLS